MFRGGPSLFFFFIVCFRTIRHLEITNSDVFLWNRLEHSPLLTAWLFIKDTRNSYFYKTYLFLSLYPPRSHSKHYYASPHSAAVQTGESNYPSLWGAHSHLPTGRPFLTYSGGKQALRLCRPLSPKPLAAFLTTSDTVIAPIKDKELVWQQIKCVFFFVFFLWTSHYFHLSDIFFSKPFHINKLALWRPHHGHFFRLIACGALSYWAVFMPSFVIFFPQTVCVWEKCLCNVRRLPGEFLGLNLTGRICSLEWQESNRKTLTIWQMLKLADIVMTSRRPVGSFYFQAAL